ncbi:hypothetical protein DL96DRAFT_1627395 [Flagelloscypha sp. PMI_526]|nr:hypothetical protein DL96DRAFT_1627395 [Flagelloscypha sp. PMI_526]
MATEMPPTTLLPDIPQELLLLILEYALCDSPCKSDISLLLLSKHLHNCILPRFYNTLQFGTQEDNAHDIDRQKLVASAVPTSLFFVRKIQSGYMHKLDAKDTFKPFSNLTHLLLWGIYGSQTSQQGLLNLPLEELIIWANERTLFLQFLATKPEGTLARTLQRFGSFGAPKEDDFRGYQVCQSLSSLLFLYDYEYPPAPCVHAVHMREVMRKTSFVSCLVIPAFERTSNDQFIDILSSFESLKDRRVVVAKSLQNNYSRGCNTPHFWDVQAALWRSAELAIQRNSQSEEITLLDQLP